MIIVFIFADPLVNTMLEWAKWLGVPSVIPVMFIPLFTSGEVVSAYNWAQGGFKGKLSMTYTSLYVVFERGVRECQLFHFSVMSLQ